MATQLKQPNLATVGALGYCLKYAREVFGVASKYATAWDGWVNAKFKHQDQNFPNVAVPIWFSYPPGGTSPGHVAVRLGNGQIYSSPYQSNTTHAVLNSIAEVEQHYRAKYVGWSEDINDVKVIDLGADMTLDQAKELVKQIGIISGDANVSKDSWITDQANHVVADPNYAAALIRQELNAGNALVNDGDITNVYLPTIGRDHNPNDVMAWNGKIWKPFIYDLLKRPDFLAYLKQPLADAQAKVAEMQKVVDDLSSRPTKDDLVFATTALQQKIDELQTQLNSQPQVDEQTVVQNWLVRLWNSLFSKKRS